MQMPTLNFLLGRRSGADVVGLDIQPGLVAAVQARVNGSILAERAGAVPLPAETVRDGEVVLMDCGCTVQGYQSDISRTFVFGRANDEQRRVWDQVHQGQQIAIRAAQIGYDRVFRVTVVSFLDRFNFCLAGVKRSCIHFVTSDGRIIPFDTYNMFHRPGLPARGARGDS